MPQHLFKWLNLAGLAVLLILHTVGVVGLLFFPDTDFASLTPLIILISTVLVLISQSENQLRFLIFFLIAYGIGFGVEYIGVQTGWPFGEYYYESNMAPLIWGTPLIIGANWFILSVGAARWSALITKNALLKIIIAALLMTGLDVLMEPIAIELNFWEWTNPAPPLENYLAWFVVSVIIQVFYQILLRNSANFLGAWYFVIVTLFFAILNLFL